MMKFFRRILWGCESLTRTFVCREEAAAKKLAAGGSIAKKAEREPEADQEPAREVATDRRAAKKAEHEPAADQEPAREVVQQRRQRTTPRWIKTWQTKHKKARGNFHRNCVKFERE